MSAKTDRRTKKGAADERVLVDKLLAGDEQAFSELVTEHFSGMVRVASAYVADKSAAEEVVQDAWVAVVKGLPKFEGRSSLKTWIYQIVVNRAKTRGVRDKRMIPFSAMDKGGDEDSPAVEPERFDRKGMWRDPPQSWSHANPEKQLLNAETGNFLEEAIGRLEPKQRLVLTLRDIEGWRSDEVCNVLEIGETYGRVLLHRARTAVRRRLERYLTEG